VSRYRKFLNFTKKTLDIISSGPGISTRFPFGWWRRRCYCGWLRHDARRSTLSRVPLTLRTDWPPDKRCSRGNLLHLSLPSLLPIQGRFL